ncbi:hypothetical protein VCHA53O466_40348 [Vibrio chagasii]|nr:hypothetical protein VCHA53O466_40348 [Vibrio chagasii]
MVTSIILAVLLLVLIIAAYNVHCVARLTSDNRMMANSFLAFTDIYNENKDIVSKLEVSTLLFEGNSDSILILTPDGVVEQGNKAFEDLYGAPSSVVKGMCVTTLLNDMDDISSLVNSTGVLRTEGRTYGGGLYPVEITLTPIYIKGKLQNIVLMLRECSSQVQVELELRKLVITDRLTGVMNRKGVEQIIEISEEKEVPYGIVFIDVDKFKPINDTYGHDVGDLFLIDITEKLSAAAQENCHVGRFGGDEFLCVVLGVTSKDELTSIGETLLAGLSAPLITSEVTLPISVSIGGALSIDTSEPISASDKAMYYSKREGGNVYVHYDAFMDDNLSSDDDTLKVQLNTDNLDTRFMPLCDLENGVTSYEVYLRNGGTNIKHFIESIDSFEAMNDIYSFILKGLSDSKQIRGKMHSGVTFSLKLERVSLLNPNFHAAFVSLIKSFDLELYWVTVRVEESHLETDFDVVSSNINSLEKMGVRVCLDDFCFGRLSIVDRLELLTTTVKLPKELVWEFYQNKSKLHKLHSIFGLASAMQTSVVVEGIETVDMEELFRDHGVDSTMGSYYGEPLKASEI